MLGSNRVKVARCREDACLEQKVREADEAAKATAQEKNVETHHDDRKAPEQVAQSSESFAELLNDAAAVPAAPSIEVETMSWEEMLDENHFHDLVNDDA